MIYEVNILDTPGLGDSRTIHKDDEHLQKIITKIVETVQNTISYSSVVFFINGS